MKPLEDKRYYIDDEHVHDKMEEIDPIYCETYNGAVKLCDFLNRQQAIIEENLDKNYYWKIMEEWEERAAWLDVTLRRINELEEIYETESEIILRKAKEAKLDFKAKYGANNDKIRTRYVNNILEKEVKELNDLKLYRDEDRRRIEVLRHRCKGLLIGYL